MGPVSIYKLSDYHIQSRRCQDINSSVLSQTIYRQAVQDRQRYDDHARGLLGNIFHICYGSSVPSSPLLLEIIRN